MQTTLELLTKALTKAETSERQLSMKLGHSPTALQMGRARGKVSPVIAGQLAEMLGEPVEHWIAVAAIEAQPRSRVTDHLRRAISAARGSSKV
jgi:hypothetical protein